MQSLPLLLQLTACYVRDKLVALFERGEERGLRCCRCDEHFKWQGCRKQLGVNAVKKDVEKRCYLQGRRYIKHLEDSHSKCLYRCYCDVSKSEAVCYF